jgi:hypothetical protein
MIFRVLQNGALRTAFGPEEECDKKAKELLNEEPDE